MRRADAELGGKGVLSHVVLSQIDADALPDRSMLLCHAQRFAQRNHISQELSLRRAIFFLANISARMSTETDWSSSLRLKVKGWLDLQPRGTQAALARFVGAKEPAISNYLAGRRKSMRANNLARMAEFLRKADPRFALEPDLTATMEKRPNLENKGN